MRAHTFAALAAACVAAPASAHHSRANFDLDSTVEITGTVKEFSWRNPHAYVVVEGRKGNITFYIDIRYPKGSRYLYQFDIPTSNQLTGYEPERGKVLFRMRKNRHHSMKIVYHTFLFLKSDMVVNIIHTHWEYRQ